MMYINKADLLNAISTQIQYNTEKPLESYTKLLNTINNFEGIDISGRLLDERQVYTVLINAYSITSADERVKLLETLNSVLTVDTVPVKHGHWEYLGVTGNRYHYSCSECGYIMYDEKYPYCGNCGAKMDEVTE